jgi:hypothetical protein
MNRRTSIGAAFGGGFEISVGPFRIEPTVRVTRWDTERTSDQPAASRLNRTQAEILLSIGRAIGPDHRPEPWRLPCCIDVGLVAGVPLLDTYRINEVFTAYPLIVDAPTRRFAAGAWIGWRFHPDWAIDAGFLVRRVGHSETVVFPEYLYIQAVTANSWEVPLQLKWRRLRVRDVPLILGAGPAARWTSHGRWLMESAGTRFETGWFDRPALGFAVSAGVEMAVGSIRFQPEVRFSWFDQPQYDFYAVTPRQASLYLLLGIGWSGRK